MFFKSRKDKISLGDFSFSNSIKRQIFLKKLKKKLTLIGMCRCSGCSVERKSAGAIFFQFYVHINVELFIHAFMHPTVTFMWWRITSMLIFFIFPV